MAFEPEGQADSSQARSAWVSMQRTPVPEGRSKSLSVPGESAGVGHDRIIFWHFACENMFCDVSNSKPRSVQSSRWDEAIFLVTPGTSCLATISLPRTKTFARQLSLTAYASASQRATSDHAEPDRQPLNPLTPRPAPLYRTLPAALNNASRIA